MASQVARALPRDQSFFKDQSSDNRERTVRLLKKRQKLAALKPRERQNAVNGKSHKLKAVSKGLKAELAKYRKLAAAFLSRPENTWCICCTIRREMGEDIVRNQATEIHHARGRIGRLLCWVPGFRPFCNSCRTWPHDHPSKARELHLLAPIHLWNTYPGEY